MIHHDDAHEHDTIDETLQSQTLGAPVSDGSAGSPALHAQNGGEERTTHGDALQGEAAEPDLDPDDYDQADLGGGIPAGQPQDLSGFEDPDTATQAQQDGPVLDPVDDADPETTGAG